MRTILTLIFLAILVSTNAQDTLQKKFTKAKQYNLIKGGAAFQGDIVSNNYDYYYYDYRYDGRHHYYEGRNLMVFLGYEHIWEYKNNMAIALEPLVGMSFHKNSNHAFIGNNTKVFLANTEIWRMGLAIYTGYSYANHKTAIVVPMDDGNYHQRMDITMHYHQLSANIAIIPFQFRVKNTPLVIESQFALFGMNVLFERSEKYQTSDSRNDRFTETYFYPYLLKAEIKVGYTLP